MNQYVTGAIIKELREKNKMTQLQLASHSSCVVAASAGMAMSSAARSIRIAYRRFFINNIPP